MVMPKISIIVPVYNVERYLETCLNSILCQTLQDVEIICVDDGSVDTSGSILDEFAKKDTRIRVLHRKNTGYGASMNAGLDAAKGEYIGIVESDDCILPQMYERLYEAAQEHDLDMVKSEAFFWYEKEKLVNRIHKSALESYFDKVLDEWDRNLFFEFYMNIWTGIYKRSFLVENKIRFHETAGAAYQDNGFWMLTNIYAKKAMWLNEAFYYYRQDNPAASIKDKGKMMAMTREYEYVEQQLIDRGLQTYLPYCYRYRIIRNLATYFRIADEEKMSYCEFLKAEYEKYMPYLQNAVSYNRKFISLVKHPKETTEYVLSRKQNAVAKLEEANSIVVYGAGVFAEKIFRIMVNEGFAKKVVCFTVTNQKTKEQLSNREVTLIQDAVEKWSDALYVVAVSKHTKAYMEMQEELKRRQINHVLDGNDLEDFFYAF